MESTEFDLTSLAADIVSAYVANNAVGSGMLYSQRILNTPKQLTGQNFVTRTTGCGFIIFIFVEDRL